jgi:hypothetical protein
MTKCTRLLLCALIALSACSSHARTSTDARRDRNLITANDIRDGHFLNAYEAVQALRPNWLAARGTDSFTKPSEIEVYYDATHLGRIESLRTIHSANIVSIRWYDGTQAQQRFGVGHSSGVILVSSRSD